ncbi:MAG: hypothetical protein CTY25_01705 [Methylobacterium sp.]|nr:MAG: hypothetical protein CTY25_01705 [Methylobacterium sp.]
MQRPISRPRALAKRRPVLLHHLMAAGLLGLLVLLLGLQPGHAQTGRRLAFVIGMADYGATQHPTALPDAGLVAQTLKGAGFEVMEAANLNQAEFRTLFREFSDKAVEAGPDSVIAVYVSGIALQDDGDNMLIPIDARLRQRNDLATEGLRIADFLRGISGLPARARLVFLDAAYQHPVLQLVADGGRGLSLIDRAEGTLIGFNQSPGRAAPLPATNYGPFAMALAEVLIEPGLPLEGMMERLRLRVHDLTQGVVTPWLINGVTPGFVLNPGAAVVVAPEAALLRERPITQLTPEQGYARAVEIDTIAAYEDFIRAFPNHALTRRARATVAARREAAYWQRTRRANTERAYWTYLKRYPKGAHAAEAEDRLMRLSAPVAPPPAFEEVFYDDLSPPPREEVVIYEEVVVVEHWERLPAPWAGPVGFLPPPPVAIVELPPPPPRVEDRGLPIVAIAAGVAGVTAAAILANRAWRRPPPVRETTFVPPPRPPREPGFGRRPVVLPAGTGERGITAPQVTNRPPLVRPNLPPPPAPGSIPGTLNPSRPGAIPQPAPNLPPAPNAAVPNQTPVPGQPPALPPGTARPNLPGTPPGVQPQPGLPPAPTPPGQTAVQPPGVTPGQRPGLPPAPTPPGTTRPAPNATPNPTGQPVPGQNPAVQNPANPNPAGQGNTGPGTAPGTVPGTSPGQRPTTLPPPVAGRPGLDGRPLPPPVAPGTPGAPGLRPDVAPPPTTGPGQRPTTLPTPNIVPGQRPGVVNAPPGTGGPGARPIGPTPPSSPGITPPRPPGSNPTATNPADRGPNANPPPRAPQIQLQPPPSQGRPLPQNQNGVRVTPPPALPPREPPPQLRAPPPTNRPAPPPIGAQQPPPQVRPAPQAPPPIARPVPPAPPPVARPAPQAPPPPAARPAPQAPAAGRPPVPCTPELRAAGRC